MQALIDPILFVLAIPATGSCLYLLGLTLLSAPLPKPAPSSRKLRFDVVIPAHNEEAGIRSTVDSVKAVDWPADAFRVLVVADNCSDATAQVAAEAGAQVLVRTDLTRRGKGYALSHAFEHSGNEGWADAVVVIDADAEVSVNLLEAIAARLERGEQAVQVHYGVSNTMASWRTRLLSIAKAAFHIVRSRARERLRLSCGIRGNGWSVTHALLKRLPYTCYSLTEDLEYGIELGLHGVRVAYADEANSDAEMVTGGKDAGQQRRRWEEGRWILMKTRTWPLLKGAITKPSWICWDLALDLMVLPLANVALNVVLLAALAAGAAWFWPVSPAWLWLSGGCVAALAIHIFRGWQLSHTGVQGLLDLFRAPFFMAWKLAVVLRGGKSKEWVRTKREQR